MTCDNEGNILRSAADATPGSKITTSFRDGKVISTVAKAKPAARKNGE
jgi:exonuclease VII large subunit